MNNFTQRNTFPHSYQFEMVNNCLSFEKGGLIQAGYGLGKTLAILMLAYYKLRKYNQRTLICCPASTIPNYLSDASKFGFDMSLLGDSRKPKDRISASSLPICIASYEILDKVIWNVDNVILDELTMVKDIRSKRFNALLEIERYNEGVLFYGFTGAFSTVELKHYLSFHKLFKTPWIGDMYSWQFINVFFDKILIKTIYSREGRKIDIHDYKIKKQYQSKLMSSLNKCVKVFDREKYNDLPELITFVKKYKDRSLNTKDVYEEFKDSSSETIIRKMTLSSGFEYENDIPVIYNTTKLDWVIDHISQLVKDNSDNILLFYQFKQEYNYISEKLKKAGIVSKEARSLGAVNDWNNGKIQVLLCHPASGGRGLNLQKGGHIFCWVSLPLSLELFQQARARLHRQNQTKTVVETVFLYEAVDIHIYNLLTNKEYVSEEIRKHWIGGAL